MRAAFPGSFDPLTVAHLAVADAVRVRHRVERLDLVISRVPLAKEERRQPPASERVAAIEEATPTRPWLAARVSDAQLLVDVAAGYDLLVVGADKWHQLHDPAFYAGDPARRDAALAALPRLVVVPRPGHRLPAGVDAHVLAIGDHFGEVSSTAVRAGRHDWAARRSPGGPPRF